MLHVDQVVKRYGSFTAVDGVSFTAEPGRIFGLLGPNGAGKTSTIRMITCITVPDAGSVTLGGQSVGPASQRRMGYLPEERGLYKKMKVGEQLVYLAQLKGMRRSDAERTCRDWMGRLELGDQWNAEVEALSKGMQQKVQFVATIAHAPDLLILDEPFSGLDPINADLLRDIIQELRADGRIILFASHRLEQVEKLCDDVCLIAQGNVVLSGALRDVKRRFGSNTLTVRFDGPDAWLDGLQQQRLVTVESRSRGAAEMLLAGATPARQVLEAALNAGADVSHFELHEPPLNVIYKLAVERGVSSDLESMVSL
ncbi:MAG: ATP-binding cassette domain-containing protein [Bacteroidota bacterium]